jgi:predicted nucleic acid-binding protein
VTTPVTVDVNVFITAVAGGNDAFHSWPSPPPVRGNLAANVLGILNDAREFSLFTTEHILANAVRVLCGTPPDGYGWEEKRAEQYIEVIIDIAEASGGAIIEPSVTVTDCPDHEDNRILECAAASGSVLIVSDDTDLLSMSPWRGTPVLTSGAFVKRTDIMRRRHRRLAARPPQPASPARPGTSSWGREEGDAGEPRLSVRDERVFLVLGVRRPARLA